MDADQDRDGLLLFALAGARHAHQAGDLSAERGALSMVLDHADPEVIAVWPKEIRGELVAALRRYAELSEAGGHVDRAQASLLMAAVVHDAAVESLAAAMHRQMLLEFLARTRDWEQLERAAADAARRLEELLKASSPEHEEGQVFLRLRAEALAKQGKAIGAAGDPGSAHPYVLEAAELARELGEATLERSLRPQTAMWFSYRKNHRRALPELTRALELLGDHDAGLRAPLLQLRAGMLSRKIETSPGRPDDAEIAQIATDYAEAAGLHEGAGAEAAAADCWYLGASALDRQHLVESDRVPLIRAIAMYERSRALHLHASRRLQAALADGAIAVVAWQLGDLDLGQRAFRRSAWSLWRSGQRQSAAEAWLGAAALQTELESARPGLENRIPRFMRTFRLALRALERARRDVLTTEWRRLEDRNGYLVTSVLERQFRLGGLAPRVQRYRDENVWLVEQLTKARELLDETVLASFRSGPDFRELQAAVAEAREQRETLQAPAGDPASRTRFRQQRADYDAAIALAESRLRNHVRAALTERPGLNELVAPRPVSVEAVRATLHGDEAYVGFLWNSGDPIRLLVTRDAGLLVSGFDAGGDGVAFLDWVAGWTRAARMEGEPPGGLGFGDRLLGALPPGVRTLLVCTDGELATLPWHAIEYQGRRVDERYAVAVVPSASTLTVARRREPDRGPGVAYLGVASNWDGSIPMVDQEVVHVRERYFAGSEALTTGDAAGLLQRSGEVGVLHIACHATREGIFLDSQRRVRPEELARLGLRASVLLLSGCETGSFGFQEGNRFDGVVRELLVATGARAAIVSAAKVRDDAGLRFSDLVASALSGKPSALVPGWGPPGPVGAGEAVRLARREMSRRAVASGPELAAEVRRAGSDLEEDDKPASDWGLPWYLIGDPAVRLPV